MNRRNMLATLAASAALWPRAALAQTPRRALIGLLFTGSKTSTEQDLNAFRLAMRELGHVEGRDYATEERYVDGNSAGLPPLAEELVRLKPDLMVGSSTPATLALKTATVTIPIVGLNITDPVGLGLVESEARPGSNVTGILIRVEGLPGKLIEIARDLAPDAGKVGVLVNTSNPSNAIQRRETELAAARLGMTLTPVEVRAGNEIGAAFETLVRERARIVIVFSDAIFNTLRRQVAAFALASRMPSVFSSRDAVQDGGLISYGTSRRESFRRAAYYVDRILKGDKPADLPIEFPTKVELVINLATATAIGLTVPPTLLARADEVIE